jgi:hypothetical protein
LKTCKLEKPYAPAGHKKTASNEWGGESKKRVKKRITERLKNGANDLPVFPQNNFLGCSALHPLVVECVHNAKLRLPFGAQCYHFQKAFLRESATIFFRR